MDRIFNTLKFYYENNFFPIETKARELDSKLLLTFKLLQNQPHGWIIFIGHYKKIPYLWNVINSPFLVFEKD